MNEQQVFNGLNTMTGGFVGQQQPQQQGSPRVLRVPLKFQHAQFGTVKCMVERTLTTGSLQEVQNEIMSLVNEGFPVDFWQPQNQEQSSGFQSGQGGYQGRQQSYGGGYRRYNNYNRRY